VQRPTTLLREFDVNLASGIDCSVFSSSAGALSCLKGRIAGVSFFNGVVRQGKPEKTKPEH